MTPDRGSTTRIQVLTTGSDLHPLRTSIAAEFGVAATGVR